MQQQSTIKPRVKIVTVTPTKAERWLRKNQVNRRLRQKLVTKYARDMVNNRWELNAETIKLATDNTLIDGQHRLYACIKANTPFETAVSYDLPIKVMGSVDIGDKRGFADRLKLEGLDKYNTIVGAVTRLVYRYRIEDTNTASYEELADLFNKHSKSIVDSVETTASFVRRGDPPCLNTTAIAFVHMLTKGKDRDRADNYAHQLVSGEGLSRKDPAHNIRAKMMRARGDRMRIGSEDQIAMMLRGWNSIRARRSHTRVYIMGKGDKGWKDIQVK